MLKLFAGLALACLCTPALAASDCASVSDLTKAVKKDGDTIAANFPVKAPIYDREIVAVYADGTQALWFFEKGCLMSPPVVLGPVSADAPDEPDAAPPSAPKQPDLGV